MKQMKQNWPPLEVLPLRPANRLHSPSLQEVQVDQQAGQSGNVSFQHAGDACVVGVYFTSAMPRPMFTYDSRHRPAAALFRVAAVMQATARYVRAAAKRLHAWLEKRRVAASAFDDLGTMSERELLDIGITRVDVPRVAWGASDRNLSP
jgi:uncharacterized protein YjiS (DUF1127 family)